MKRILGKMSIHHLFDWRNRVGDTIQETIAAFLTDGDVGEHVAARWVETPKAVIILQMIKNDPECGGIFAFDRESSQWYLLDFERFDRPLTPSIFDRLFREYKLFNYLDQPGLLSKSRQAKA
ncbi:hypothetical protein [Acidicapsa ligni]|uniref:hypothetical protein n=1 Tax=Acidicapsa ligni TaxID=542300 RepID=UPI0021E0C686|nr:hypothetical protein [Acidicapsa ligni]